MFDKLKQIKNLRSQANQIKTELAAELIEGVNSSDEVKITMDGNQEVKKVTIDSTLSQDQDKLQIAVQEAVNDAIKKVQQVMAKKMSQLGNFNLPDL